MKDTLFINESVKGPVLGASSVWHTKFINESVKGPVLGASSVWHTAKY